MKTDTTELRREAHSFEIEGAPDVAALLRSAADELDRLRAKAGLCKWEAEHQQGALQELGLAEEFPLGCDSIEWVGQALLDARRELDAARKIIDALPKTADGVAIVPGMSIWIDTNGELAEYEVLSVYDDQVNIGLDLDCEVPAIWYPHEVYSTEAAALAAGKGEK